MKQHTKNVIQGKIYRKRKEYYLKNIERITVYQKQYRINNREKALINPYTSIDKKKQRICDLTTEWIKENITSKPCIYCGTLIGIGCDRIDNNKGHTKDNVIPCCGDCNKTRSNLYTFEEMRKIGVVIKQIKEERITRRLYETI